jgi:hypothetical protein
MMLKHLLNLLPSQIDPRVYQLEQEVDTYQIVVWGLAIIIVLLVIIVILQRLQIVGFRHGKTPRLSLGKKKKGDRKVTTGARGAPGGSSGPGVTPKELPDPGLIFKYSLANENVMEKTISIGQRQGQIKTYSTEIIDDHLSLFIRIIENSRERDIYNLPDKIWEEYQIDLRRDGKVLVYYPGLEGFREMGSRERIYIKNQPDETGEPTFPALPAKTPIRFRLGDRLNQEGKFTTGYFEFHLFTQDYDITTKAGIPKTEKNFFIRLYKIYPGYDTGASTGEGLYPMVDPFTSEKRNG